MLKFVNIDPDELISNVEIDYYVPFTIDVHKPYSISENTLYWRTGNFDTSLLEIGIGEKSGILKSITLTMANKADNNGCVNFEAEDIMNGIPVFDISMMENQLFDYISEYNVYLFTDNVIVDFSKDSLVKTIIKMGRVDMGFGFENELIFTRINKLSTREYDDLKDSFKI